MGKRSSRGRGRQSRQPSALRRELARRFTPSAVAIRVRPGFTDIPGSGGADDLSVPPADLEDQGDDSSTRSDDSEAEST